MTRDEAVDRVREIYKEEQFRMDALFFCGFPSGMPNEELMKACQVYLEALDRGEDTSAAAGSLIAELEAAARKNQDTKVDNLIDNAESMRALLKHRDLL